MTTVALFELPQPLDLTGEASETIIAALGFSPADVHSVVLTPTGPVAVAAGYPPPLNEPSEGDADGIPG